MNRRVRIAVQLAPQRGDYARLRDAAVEADELGVDVIFNWDHFFPLSKVEPRGKHFECWTTLASWAEATRDAEIGSLVSCAAYRNPDLLADMARTVDHISGGRVILGVGPGFKKDEFEEYGYAFGSPGQRVRQMGEVLDRIGDRLTRLNPPPIRKMPVLVAADGPKALRVAARHADIWQTFADGDDLAEKSRQLDDLCRELGRDPADIERAVLVGGDPWQAGPELLKRGVGLFTKGSYGPDWDLSELRRWLEWRDEINVERGV